MVAVVSPERAPRVAQGRMAPSYERGRPLSPVVLQRVAVADAGTVRRPVRLPASTYRRRRAVAAGLVVVAVLVLSAALGMLGGGPLPAPDRPAPSRSVDAGNGPFYVVQPGDTFWSIARRLEPRGDPRPLVDRLVAAHGGATLHVGERIPLPVS